MEKQNLALVTQITNNNADCLIGVCSDKKIYNLSFTLEGERYVDFKVQLIDENTSKLIQIINPNNVLKPRHYSFKFVARKSGNLKFAIQGAFSLISNIVLTED